MTPIILSVPTVLRFGFSSMTISSTDAPQKTSLISAQLDRYFKAPFRSDLEAVPAPYYSRLLLLWVSTGVGIFLLSVMDPISLF